MTLRLLVALLSAAPLLAAGCRQETAVRPRAYDALALATGHWEWDGTSYSGGRHTPATVGFTRQLVFTADGQVVITHNHQPNKTTPYALAMGSVPACGSTEAVPVITYETDSDVGNNDRKTYRLTKSGEGQQLVLTGDLTCVKKGAVETYRWVPE